MRGSMRNVPGLDYSVADPAPRHRRARDVSRRADRASEARAAKRNVALDEARTAALLQIGRGVPRVAREASRRHDRELWVGFYKKASGKGGITYRRRSTQRCASAGSTASRSASTKTATCTASRRARATATGAPSTRSASAQLARGAASVAPAGLEAFERRDEKTSEKSQFERKNARRSTPHASVVQGEREARGTFFRAQPPGYQRLLTFWVMSAKKEETRLRRLARCSSRSRRKERDTHDRDVASVPHRTRHRARRAADPAADQGAFRVRAARARSDRDRGAAAPDAVRTAGRPPKSSSAMPATSRPASRSSSTTTRRSWASRASTSRICSSCRSGAATGSGGSCWRISRRSPSSATAGGSNGRCSTGTSRRSASTRSSARR